MFDTVDVVDGVDVDKKRFSLRVNRKVHGMRKLL